MVERPLTRLIYIYAIGISIIAADESKQNKVNVGSSDLMGDLYVDPAYPHQLNFKDIPLEFSSYDDAIQTILEHQAAFVRLNAILKDHDYMVKLMQAELQDFKHAMIQYMEEEEQLKKLYDTITMLALLQVYKDSIMELVPRYYHDSPEVKCDNTTEECYVETSTKRRQLQIAGGLAYRLADTIDTLFHGDPSLLGRFLRYRQGPLEALFGGRRIF